MIHAAPLSALVAYYDRLAADVESSVAPPGFERKEIPFVIILDESGHFLGIQDTRSEDARRGRGFLVPQAVKRSSGIAANLLWDGPAYVFARPKPDPTKDVESLRSRAQKQQQAFIAQIRSRLQACIDDPGVAAVLQFLERGDFGDVFEHPAWPEIEESSANLSFQLKDDDELVCQRSCVIEAIAAADEDGHASKERCLITGNMDTPVRLHAPIKGVRGAQSTGGNIVSFNLDAFNSYGKSQGFNAPVGKKAEFAYTTALNTLLRAQSHHRMQVGDATTVFWAEKPNPIEDALSGFFGLGRDQSEPDVGAIRALFASPKTGAPPFERDLTPFYVLGLAPNAARLAVRFWYAGTVSQIADHIRCHFEDCAITHGERWPEFLGLNDLLRCTAAQGKLDNIQPNMAGDLMKSILSGTQYPRTLLSSVVRRIRAEQSRRNQAGSPMQNVTYPRAALIKGILVRNARFAGRKQMEVGMTLDESNTNLGYRLGRLFAVLERAQEIASPGINATIRDRFYGSASGSPVIAFPQLMKLKNHHVAKIENRGAAVNVEKRISEIMSGISEFPAHLDLTDQGRFAVGYYHQRQAFFTKTINNDQEPEV